MKHPVELPACRARLGTVRSAAKFWRSSAVACALAAIGAAPPALQRTVLQHYVVPEDARLEVYLLRVDIPPGAGSTLHMHPGVESGYVLSGTAQLTMGGVKTALATGATFLIPKG